MKYVGTHGPTIIGAVVILYTYTIGGITSRHSVQNYLLLCTGIISISLGLVAHALTFDKSDGTGEAPASNHGQDSDKAG